MKELNLSVGDTYSLGGGVSVLCCRDLVTRKKVYAVEVPRAFREPVDIVFDSIKSLMSWNNRRAACTK